MNFLLMTTVIDHFPAEHGTKDAFRWLCLQDELQHLFEAAARQHGRRWQVYLMSNSWLVNNRLTN